MREKLGRNDPCPCGSTRRFQELLHARRPTRRRRAGLLFSANKCQKTGEISASKYLAGLSCSLAFISTLTCWAILFRPKRLEAEASALNVDPL
ncbi:SEC-C metal-binding domain-containing protein [Chthoniobacter flavus]|uniref:SEC-C metal-binding domain-containing protein n=1 Tax=Chthoniobacter flavus TaxID=191863 RepID=UPI003B4373AD